LKPHEKLEFEIMIDNMAKLTPAMLGIYPSIAKLTHSYFNELVKEGFTESQALHIVAIQGVTARLGESK